MFFSGVNFELCADSYSVLPQWHVKDPGHSAKSAGSKLHLNMHTPLTERSRSGLTMPLARHRVGTFLEKSSYATRQGTFGYSRLSSLSLGMYSAREKQENESLFLSVPHLKPCGKNQTGEQVACVTISPHLRISSYIKVQCYPPPWQPHSDFGDFNAEVGHVMKIMLPLKVILRSCFSRVYFVC